MGATDQLPSPARFDKSGIIAAHDTIRTSASGPGRWSRDRGATRGAMTRICRGHAPCVPPHAMTSTTMKFGTAAALGLGVMAALLPGQPAQACGGFFCNQPQNPFDPPPVAQTGENVLFAMQSDPQTGANHLEAHVQIYYTGPADKFSWVVPVDSEPTLDVGTNQLFKVLEPATRPSFTVNTQEEGNCRVDTRPNI